MKKLLYSLMIPALAAAFVSCGDDPVEGQEPPSQFYLTVKGSDGNTPSALNFNTAAASQTLTIESNGSWSVAKSGDAWWLTVKPSNGKEGGSVAISVDANGRTEPRTADLTFRLDGKETMTIPIVQNQADAYMRVKDTKGGEPAKVDFKADGGSVTYVIESNAGWSISKPAGCGWLTIAPNSGTGDVTVTVSAAESKEFEMRPATLTFLLGTDVVTEVLTEQLAGSEHSMSVTPESKTLPFIASEITFDVASTASDWKYELIGTNTGWLTEKSKTATTLTLSATENGDSGERKLTVKFSSPSQAALIASIPVTQRIFAADLLDVVFNSDGTATDISPLANTVERVAGEAMLTYHSDVFDRNVAWFNHAPGTTVSTGYYKVDYSGSQEFKDGLADGHTLELLFMYNSELVTGEVKPLGAHQNGGTGFLVANSTRNNEITFLPHVGGGWKWAQSGVSPQKGKYYHVVGVWDKSEAKALIYVNGVAAPEVAASGNFTHAAAISQWFCIGGDASGTAVSPTNAWCGDIVLARAYDVPLAQSKVDVLWNRVKTQVESATSTISLSDILFLSNIEVAVGSGYKISGLGFQSGDKVRFESGDGSLVRDCSTTYTTDAEGMGYLRLDIPSGLITGSYRLILLRGSASSPLGSATLTVSATPAPVNKPRIIAHRGYHTNGAPENSMASFRAADELGLYGSETDFWITADGKLVCNHDAAYSGVTLETSNYSAIQNLKLSNGEKLPLFSDYMDYMQANPGAMKLIIEIKNHANAANTLKAVDAIVEQVAAYNMADRVEYIAFSWAACLRLVEKTPAGTMVGYLDGSATPATCASAGIMCIDYSVANTRLYSGYVKQAHDLGMVVNVWTVNSTSEMFEFMNMGVDFITTNYPQTLKQLLKLVD